MISLQIILYIISSGIFLSLLVMGFGLTLRSVRFFNLAYGGSFLIGGYMMFLFFRTLSLPFILALMLSLLASGLYLSLSYKFIFHTLLRRKASNLVLLITSFGLLTATSAIIGMIFGNQTTLIAHRLSDIGVVNIFGASLDMIQIIGIITIPIIVIIFSYIRSKTRFGRATRAIEDDSEVAELVGIPKEKTLFKIFFISGVLGGLWGIAEGFEIGLIPATGLLYILPTIVATVVGGMKSFWGGILGAFILATAQQLTIVFFGGSWVQAVPFVILIIVLLVRPKGILEK